MSRSNIVGSRFGIFLIAPFSLTRHGDGQEIFFAILPKGKKGAANLAAFEAVFKQSSMVTVPRHVPSGGCSDHFFAHLQVSKALVAALLAERAGG